MKLPFAKMHGLGNDFVVIDQRARDYQLAPAQLRLLADRRHGIGCDQILFLEPAHSTGAAARYRVANADGSAAEHCGNGIRCIARYLQTAGETSERLYVEIGEALFELLLMPDDNVRVDMGRARFTPADIPLSASEQALRYHGDFAGRRMEFGAVSIGNPHAVLEVASLADTDVAGIGAAVQASALFPAGVNVGFMQIEASNAIQLRVFERGVGETQACGTGACAAVAIGRRWQRLDNVVEVHLTGGNLQIEWSGKLDDSIWMTGPATFVFEGSIEL